MRRRIIVCLGVLFGLCLLGGTIAMLCLERSTHRLGALVESHRIQSLRATLTSDGVRIETDLLAHLAGREHAAEQRAEHVRRFAESLRRCGGCHHPPHLKAKLDAIEETFEAYEATAKQLFTGNGTEKMEALEQKALMLVNRLTWEATQMADQAGRHLAVKSTDAAASIGDARLVLSVTLAAVFVGGGVVALHLKRRLTKPVEGLLQGIERVRQGDLSHRLSIDGDEEFRLLADAFNRAHEDLKNAQDSVLQAEKMAAVGKLAAGVAHEVGNPLASVSAVVQIMRRRCESEEQAEQFDLIMEEVARASRVLRELLTFSRTETDGQQDRVEIGALLDRAVSLLGYHERARGIRITRRHDADPAVVRGDGDKLLLLFTNIMINAFDAVNVRDDGHRTLDIALRQADERVIVQFEDNGPGMSKENVSRAFDPFFTTKEQGEGTGLGLWICYQVIEKHNGTIYIDSRLGEGTTVTVELPSEPPSADQEYGERSTDEIQPPVRLTQGCP